MDRRTFLGAGAAFAAVMTLSPTLEAAHAAEAADGKIVELPAVDKAGGKPLMACMNERRSKHQPGRKEVSPEHLAGILWSACGVNNDKGKRVIPTARNRQHIEVYAVLADGVWLYLPEKHAIKRVLMGDRRSSFDNSGCILLYMAPSDDIFGAMHVGSMYQDVCLYCASEGPRNCVKYQKADALDAELPRQHGWKTFITHSIAG
ncbi:MAG: hypothetical protein Q4F72_08385 [Desulfovibrionaceae bacterium]|nr:hypothetical protein [Desulfovibrionaceae bacterium]